jgi:hypothetical protein
MLRLASLRQQGWFANPRGSALAESPSSYDGKPPMRMSADRSSRIPPQFCTAIRRPVQMFVNRSGPGHFQRAENRTFLVCCDTSGSSETMRCMEVMLPARSRDPSSCLSANAPPTPLLPSRFAHGCTRLLSSRSAYLVRGGAFRSAPRSPLRGSRGPLDITSILGRRADERSLFFLSAAWPSSSATERGFQAASSARPTTGSMSNHQE